METSSNYDAESRHFLPKPSTFSIHDEEEDRDALLPPKDEFYRDEPNTPREHSSSRSFHVQRPLTFISAIIRILPWVFVVSVLGWMSSAFYYQVRTFKTDVKVLQFKGEEVEEIQNDTLPQKPTPIIVTDQAGQAKWTVSVPPWLEFPLKPQQYDELCMTSMKYSEHLDVNRSKFGHYSYYHVDEYYMSVAEAEDAGLLPTNPVTKWSSYTPLSTAVDSEDSNADSAGYCKRSLTLNLETTDAGFGNTLMLLWLSYGLAMEEGRAFFVDDRNWAYGDYKTYFQPAPNQGCLPPPEHHKLPCPHHADHLVVSHGTQSVLFGHQFTEEYENPKAMNVERQEWIYGMMRRGYEDLFHLEDSDQKVVDNRVNELREKVGGGIEVGIHVRHGDRHPWEFAYENFYIPLERFVETAWEMAEEAHNESLATREASAGVFKDLYASKMVLASDDPFVYSSDEMVLAVPAQEEILLGQDKILDPDMDEDDDEWISPWEGGFTRDKFWKLGGDGSSSKHKPRGGRLGVRDFDDDGKRVQPLSSQLKLRSRIGRAYLMDLAILSKTDRIVCTTSSIACRILAVTMGWDKAIEQGHWRNIDGEWFWKGIRWS